MSSAGSGASANGRGSDAWARPWAHLNADRRSLTYCRVTFDHPPTNTITATTVAELAELIGLIEEDPDLNVVVFDSANPDFYLDGAGQARTHGWLDVLVRLSQAPAVSIASIRGMVRGAGCEFALACDLRFASSEDALLGHVNRLIADDRLDAEVDRIARRIARFDSDAMARTKSDADRARA